MTRYDDLMERGQSVERPQKQVCMRVYYENSPAWFYRMVDVDEFGRPIIDEETFDP